MLGQIISDSAYNTTNRYVEPCALSAGAAGIRWVVGASRSEQSVQVLSDGVWRNGIAAFGIPAGGVSASTTLPARAATRPCSAKPRCASWASNWA
jgi:hypothetical protein